MKNMTYIMAFAIFLTASCQKNEFKEEPVHENAGHIKVLTVGVAEEPETRVGFDGNNSFYWHRGDRIGVITTAGFKEMILDDQYHRQPSGVFLGDFEENMGDYVVYPHGSHLLDNGQLTYILPSEYTYTSIGEEDNSFNPPMYGKIENNSAFLRHLGSFFKISL